MYHKMGCRVIGIDPSEGRRKLAEEMGIPKTDSGKEILTENVDIAVDVTGLPQAIIDCIDVTKSYGQTVLLGSPRQSYETDVMPLLSKIHMKDLKILGAFNQTSPVYPHEGSDDSMIRNFKVVSDLFMNKDIDVSKLISRIIDPKDCEQAYYDLMYNKDKVNLIVYDWRNY